MRLFGIEVAPADVGQGYLGDCYLMSVLASLAQRPDFIKSLITVHHQEVEYSPNLTACDQGEKYEHTKLGKFIDSMVKILPPLFSAGTSMTASPSPLDLNSISESLLLNNPLDGFRKIKIKQWTTKWLIMGKPIKVSVDD